MKKKILMTIGIIVAIWISFATIECIRLGNTKSETKPIITVDLVEYENKSKYAGLGYSITYYKDSQENIYGAEFRLLDSILIWGWVE